jgi:SDR family mycofactocin-dependent oxidoreductase
VSAPQTRRITRARRAARAQPLARRARPEPGGKRVAIVTGAARGIGAATVRELVRAGWAVVAVDRAADDARVGYALGTRDELRALVRDRVEAVEGDVAREVVLREAVAVAERSFGGLDAFVACAGVIAGGVPLWEMPSAEVEAVLDVDLLAVITAARVAIPALLRRPEPRDGRFIAVASAGASSGLPMLAAYCAAKAGVTGLIRALAAELRGTGITANGVSPGSTRTAMLDESARLYGLESAESFAEKAPIERLLEPEEVATFIAWLAGPGGRGATGADFPFDGGLTA